MEYKENYFELLSFPSKEKKLNFILEELRAEELVIYGAGSMGRLMLNFLKSKNVSVEFFLDQNANKLGYVSGVPVFTLDGYTDVFDKKTLILSIILDKNQRKELIDKLSSYGFKKIIDANSLVCFDIKFSNGYKERPELVIDKIDEAYNLLNDEISRKIFLNNIYSHLSGDYSNCVRFEDSMANQYFPKDIEYLKDYSVYVDCGAYTGDTIERLLMNYTPNTIIGFEPFEKHYKSLLENVKSKFDLDVQLYNYAVSNNEKTCKFKIEDDSAGSGCISDSGDLLIKSVKMDDFLEDLHPTFVKMDIEGEELRAVEGSVNIIAKSHPDLAVCVYHNIEHIWEIPLLINKIYSEYKFYLRTYNSYTYETVLYAFK